jgi:hypothetical protein
LCNVACSIDPAYAKRLAKTVGEAEPQKHKTRLGGWPVSRPSRGQIRFYRHCRKDGKQGIPRTAARLLNTLLGLALQFGRVYPSLLGIARLACVCKQTVVSCLTLLELYGFVIIQRRIKRGRTPRGTKVVQDTNAYTIQEPKGLGALAVSVLGRRSTPVPSLSRDAPMRRIGPARQVAMRISVRQICVFGRIVAARIVAARLTRAARQVPCQASAGVVDGMTSARPVGAPSDFAGRQRRARLIEGGLRSKGRTPAHYPTMTGRIRSGQACDKADALRHGRRGAEQRGARRDQPDKAYDQRFHDASPSLAVDPQNFVHRPIRPYIDAPSNG